MPVSEGHPTPTNRLGLDGLEFIEFTTSQPLVLGALLEKMGFRPVARHRSREVLLYRQGSMNLVVNAHPGAVRMDTTGQPVMALGAMAFRVADAGDAHRRTIELGAWDLPTRAAAMELVIPGIRGAGESHIYFVDRHGDFSIYDVDFTPIAGADPNPPALGDMHYFGVVQTAYPERTAAWLEFYQSLFGFNVLPSGRFFGVVNTGVLLESPCRKFFLQLIEPPDTDSDVVWEEGLLRIGLGTPDVLAAMRALQARGIVFVDRGSIRPTDRGAVTQLYPGGVSFELVHSHQSASPA
jgi:4-hydroxyphenylpyruvate dioxygenase